MGFLFANTPATFTKKSTLIVRDKLMARPTPQVAVEIIKKFEGLRTTAYQDANGIWTIGYGNTREVHPGEVITDAEAEEELKEYLQNIGPSVIKDVIVPLNNNQYAALLSFVYNVGIGNLQRSTLLKLINAKDDSHVLLEFVKWDKDEKGVSLPGLKARRLAEVSLYFTPVGAVH